MKILNREIHLIIEKHTFILSIRKILDPVEKAKKRGSSRLLGEAYRGKGLRL